MKITTSQGEMLLDDDSIPSEADMNDIIASVTADDDNGAQFQRLCDASTQFPADISCAEFLALCEAWDDPSA